MSNKTKYFKLLIFYFLGLIVMGCSKFLDEKPDRSLALADGVKELQAILDYDVGMNQNYPVGGDIASDYYYLNDGDYATRNQVTRDMYIWDGHADNFQDWQNAYTRIFYANVVLDNIDQAKLDNKTELDRSVVKGSALFFRAWNLFHLSQIYCLPYRPNSTDLGIPLRLEADINLSTLRSSLQETFAQIINDLERAAANLPEMSLVQTRPSKAAAYAALSIVYLTKGDYTQSGNYADSCLMIQNSLIDYNSINASSTNPFTIFNQEVIFHATMFGTPQVFSQNRAKVSKELFQSYESDDLRRSIFYRENTDGSLNFKGDYSGSNTSGLPFCGIATDEIYLVKAESAARIGMNDDALEYLNRLMKKRYMSISFKPFQSDSSSEILDKVILEKKKQLAFRGGVAWRELKRLSWQGEYGRELTRVVSGKKYILSPGDLRYAFLIPISVIQISSIEQNRR